jgi:hypothetical protein
MVYLHSFRFELNKKNRSPITKETIVYFFKLRDIKGIKERKQIIARML